MKDESYFKETGISHEMIYDGKVLHVCKDKIRLPNGRESMREYCLHNGAVAVVALTDDNEVICVRQYRYAVGAVTTEIPAGKLDHKGESPIEAALRELREETGYRCKKITHIGDLLSSPAILTEVIHMYFAEGLIPGDTDPDDDEFLELVKIPLGELKRMIIDGEIRDAKTQAAVLKVAAMLEEK